MVIRPTTYFINKPTYYWQSAVTISFHLLVSIKFSVLKNKVVIIFSKKELCLINELFGLEMQLGLKPIRLDLRNRLVSNKGVSMEEIRLDIVLAKKNLVRPLKKKIK